MKSSGLKRVQAFFFATQSSHEPVREWLKALDREDRRDIGRDLMTLEFDWPIGMPLARAMGDGLHELRVKLARNRNARILFYVDREERRSCCTRFSSAAGRHRNAISILRVNGCESINGASDEEGC